MEPRCQAPAQAVSGVTGAARQQMMMSASAILQMYMLDLVCSTLLLSSDCDSFITQCPTHLRTVKITIMFPPIPMVIMRPYRRMKMYCEWTLHVVSNDK